MAPTTAVDGLHHVTSISGSAAATHAFHAGVLGQRLVKKTVNFDDPTTYHLYYGDETGRAGTVMTFFPWEGARTGRIGAGQVAITQFAVPKGALDLWERRLVGAGAPVRARERVFGEERLVTEDRDGLLYALVETDVAGRAPWTTEGIGEAAALRGFHGATLALADGAATARLLVDALGYRQTDEAALGETGRLLRFEAATGRARVIDLHVDPAMPRGAEGAGTVHHIAFSVPDRAAQAEVRKALLAAGQAVTPAIDRQYFHAIYTRTPGGVLFEVATEEPGFATDEPVEALGTALKLPPQHEALRDRIEAVLPPLAA